LLEVKPTLHFHSLRHGFASNAVSKGIPIHHVRTLMGHSNISTTNVYLEMNPKEALKSYEELF
jgi:integrase/recombinase XerD